MVPFWRSSYAAAIVVILAFAIGNCQQFEDDILTVTKYASGHHLFKPIQFHDEKFKHQKIGLSTAVTNTTSIHHKNTYFVFEINGTKYKVELSLNLELLPRSFSTTLLDDNVAEIRHPSTKERNHCYYQGSVQGVKNSKVVMSTCYGLSGTIFLDDRTLMINPISKPTTFKQASEIHAAYHVDENEFSGACGNRNSSQELISMINKIRALTEMEENEPHLRHRRDATTEKKFVELMMVSDKAVTSRFLEDPLLLDHKIIEIVNYIDTFYRMLNIRVALSNIEKWKTDKIPLKTNAQEVLNEFLSYRQTKRRSDRSDSSWVYVDNVQLLYGGDFDGSTIGMATVGTMCTDRSGGVNQDKSSTLSVAATIAHEMGHNFGMNHDTSDCACPTDKECLMAPSSGSSPEKAWSSCSKTYLEQSLRLGLGNCLLNVPPPDRLYAGAKCGNDIVEEGEECDCGLAEDCKSTCCNATTCMLQPNAQCDSGECCSGCQYTRAGTMCRATNGNECDLPEYCSGHSTNCPGNVYMQNGWPCASKTAMCAEGVCLTHDIQCENVWGEGAVNGDVLCYEYVNKRGNKNGNCGRDDKGNFIKCTKGNSTCGKLQCSGGQRHPIVNRNYEAYLNTVTLNGVRVQCKATYSDANATDVSDPGLVKDGSMCGDGKVCSDGNCVVMTALTCVDKCNGNGVCNNNLNCHCEAGFSPPDCLNSGTGGSVDSGPISEDLVDTQMVLMLVMFLVVLPLILGLGTFLWFRYCGGRAYIQKMRKNRQRRQALSKKQSSDYHSVALQPTVVEEEERLEAVRRNKLHALNKSSNEKAQVNSNLVEKTPYIVNQSRWEQSNDSWGTKPTTYDYNQTNGWDNYENQTPSVRVVPNTAGPVRPPPPAIKTPQRPSQPPVRPAGPPPRPTGTPARAPPGPPPPAPVLPVAAIKPFTHTPPSNPPPQFSPAPPPQIPGIKPSSTVQPPSKPLPPTAPFKPPPPAAAKPPPPAVSKPAPPQLPPAKPQPPAMQNKPTPARTAPTPPTTKPAVALKTGLPPSVARKPYHGSNPLLSMTPKPAFTPASQHQRPQSSGNFTDISQVEPESPEDLANLSVMERARLFAQAQQ